MKKIIIILILFTAGAVFRAEAQYGFGTNSPDPQALIDMADPTKGLLIPRVSLQGMTSISPFSTTPAVSMLVWNTGTGGLTPLSPAGFYYWDGGQWNRLVVTSQLPQAPTGSITSATLDISGGSNVVPNNVTINMKGTMKWFYMPGVPISTITPGSTTVNLYSVYTSQFTNVPSTRNSTGVAASIPVFAANELDYYVIGYDTNVFTVTQVDADGTMHYTVSSNPATACSFINVVFVIK